MEQLRLQLQASTFETHDSGSSFSSKLLEIFNFLKFIVHFQTGGSLFLFDIFKEIILSSEILIRMCRTVCMRLVNVKYYNII